MNLIRILGARHRAQPRPGPLGGASRQTSHVSCAPLVIAECAGEGHSDLLEHVEGEDVPERTIRQPFHRTKRCSR
jgi:hypothetical protein